MTEDLEFLREPLKLKLKRHRQQWFEFLCVPYYCETKTQ